MKELRVSGSFANSAIDTEEQGEEQKLPAVPQATNECH
jgi:hypothetical protein